MTHAFYSDAAEKACAELARPEQAAVESVRRALEDDPEQGRGLPDADPRSESYVVELLPEQTGGRGFSVVYRYSEDLDAALILWLMPDRSDRPDDADEPATTVAGSYVFDVESSGPPSSTARSLDSG